MVDELMSKNLINAGSLGWVIVQNLSNKISSGVRDRHILWEGIGIHSDSLISGLHITCFEGRLANYQGVDNNA